MLSVWLGQHINNQFSAGKAVVDEKSSWLADKKRI